MADEVEVYLEAGRTRTFACALAWPGWARSARTRDGEPAAIEALLAHADRYSAVARRADVAFPGSPRLVVVESLVGTATTDFGAPDREPAADAVVLPAAARDRQVRLLEAAWQLLDDVAVVAPRELRRGPRGGGRDTVEVVRHVVEAERAYARKFGVRHKPFDPHDPVPRDRMRAELAAALRAGPADQPWSAAYAIRRTAWHVLDHAWEIEDRS